MKTWHFLLAFMPQTSSASMTDRMCMFEVLKSVGKCDKITDVKYLMKMALQLNSYKKKIGRVARVEDSLYERITHPSDENEEKRAVPVTTVIPEVKRKKESGQRLLREKTTASTTVLKQQENKSKETNAATVTAAAMAATKAKKQLLKIVPEDKIVFNPPFTSVSSSNISVSNPTENDTIAFKIKTTAPKRYCVRPNVGILKPGETSDVKVLLQPGETDEKHKFQVQSLVVPENYESLTPDEKATVWKSTDNPSMSTRLTCVFVSDKPIPATIPEEPTETSTTEEGLYQHQQSLQSKPMMKDGGDGQGGDGHIEEILRLRSELKTAREHIESLTSIQNVPTNGATRGFDAKALYISIILSFFFGYVISSCYM